MNVLRLTMFPFKILVVILLVSYSRSVEKVSSSKSSNTFINTLKVSNSSNSPPEPPTVSKNSPSSLNNTQDTTHMGREHTIDTPKVLNVTTLKSILPLDGVPEKNDNKKSVPKKEAKFPDDMVPSQKSTKSPAVVKHKKPLILEADNATPPPSNKTRLNPEFPSIEYVTEKKRNRRANYVVPIVAVILSVPLVAIIFSVLYKRGAEWWQHRHYRRMDFLIEGMYNN